MKVSRCRARGDPQSSEDKRRVRQTLSFLTLPNKPLYHLRTVGYWLAKKVHLISLSAGLQCAQLSFRPPFSLRLMEYSREKAREWMCASDTYTPQGAPIWWVPVTGKITWQLCTWEWFFFLFLSRRSFISVIWIRLISLCRMAVGGDHLHFFCCVYYKRLDKTRHYRGKQWRSFFSPRQNNSSVFHPERAKRIISDFTHRIRHLVFTVPK